MFFCLALLNLSLIFREHSAITDKRQQTKQEISALEQQLDEVEATLRTKQTDQMHLEENKTRIEQEERNVKIDFDQKKGHLSEYRWFF